MIQHNFVAIIIILFNDYPKQYAFEQQDVNVIIVDNTPFRDLKLRQKNVIYKPLFDNYGIAKALNIGFNIAKELGAKWVLTMDQDSSLSENMIDEYLKFIQNKDLNLGLVAPLINMYNGEGLKAHDSFQKIDLAITSGSFISMQAYDAIGGFKEELFIDGVDFEFCLNLKKHGFTVYQLNRVLMQHQLGNTVEYKLLGKHLFYITHHNYIRRYYITRNGLYLNELYIDILPQRRKFFQIVIPLVKIVFFEKDVKRKLKAMYLGYIDFKNRKFGKFEYNL